MRKNKKNMTWIKYITKATFDLVSYNIQKERMKKK